TLASIISNWHSYHRTLHSFPTRRSSDLGRDQVLVVHGRDQRFADPVLDFQEHVGVVLLADQLPYRLALLHRQGFQDERDIGRMRSEEHTSELQSRENLVCRLLLEKKK